MDDKFLTRSDLYIEHIKYIRLVHDYLISIFYNREQGENNSVLHPPNPTYANIDLTGDEFA